MDMEEITSIRAIQEELTDSLVEESIVPDADYFVAVEEHEIGNFFRVCREMGLSRSECSRRSSDGTLIAHLSVDDE